MPRSSDPGAGRGDGNQPGDGNRPGDTNQPGDSKERRLDDAGGPSEPAGRTIGDLDGGVARRLARRCRVAGSVQLVLGAGLLAVPVLRAWDPVSAAVTLLALPAVVAGAMLARRATLWSIVGAAVLPGDPGAPATVGPPRLLSPGRPGAPIRRKLGAVVVPIHALGGSSPGGGALVVHARPDSELLAGGDAVRVWRIGPGGLEAPRVGTTGPPRQAASTPAGSAAGGRFVLYREADGAAFLATTRLTDTW